MNPKVVLSDSCLPSSMERWVSEKAFGFPPLECAPGFLAEALDIQAVTLKSHVVSFRVLNLLQEVAGHLVVY